MANYCLQLGTKIESWFRKMGTRWREKRASKSVKCGSDPNSVWNEHLVPLDLSEGRLEKTLSLETQYFHSQSTISDRQYLTTSTSHMPSRTTVRAATEVAAQSACCYLCGLSSSRSDALAVGSCPSRIQTHDWFFPAFSDEQPRNTEETDSERDRGGIDRANGTVLIAEWTWFPGDDDFREKIAESGRVPSKENITYDSRAGLNTGYVKACHYPAFPDTVANMSEAYDPLSYNEVWNESQIPPSETNVHPTRLAESERMLTDIIFGSQQRKIEEEENGERKTGTQPVVIGRCDRSDRMGDSRRSLQFDFPDTQRPHMECLKEEMGDLIQELNRLIEDVTAADYHSDDSTSHGVVSCENACPEQEVPYGISA